MIFLSGSHRSGTSWSARILSTAPGLSYIYEPFNLEHSRSNHGVPFPHWYTYLDDDAWERYGSEIRRVIFLREKLWPRLSSAKSASEAWNGFKWVLKCHLARIQGNQILIKDPIAIFSLERIAAEFSPRMVVLIRHPAAFVSSIKKAGWRWQIADIVAQKPLLEFLSPWADQLLAAHKSPLPLLEEACLSWNVQHWVISEYQKRHPDWLFRKHEDLAANARTEFSSLFDLLGLKKPSDFDAVIQKFCGENNVKDTKDLWDMNRSSKDVIGAWGQRLNPEEIEMIRSKTAKISAEFYTEDSWKV